MKAILMSIRPEWVAKILNGEKTIEIRKTAPKYNLPIDAYIYCTKGGLPLEYIEGHGFSLCAYHPSSYKPKDLRGKVVAKFTLRKLEEFINGLSPLEREYCHVDNEFDYQAYENVLEKACLTYEQACEYAPDDSFYVWYISDLVIFDKPMQLEDFGLKRAPQSWQYIEVEE